VELHTLSELWGAGLGEQTPRNSCDGLSTRAALVSEPLIPVQRGEGQGRETERAAHEGLGPSPRYGGGGGKMGQPD
jgi:hypothetical protein